MAKKIYTRRIRIDELAGRIAFLLHEGKYWEAQAFRNFFGGDVDEKLVSEKLEQLKRYG